ncbi:Uncharacterised protein [Nocardia cyriacigeorgica]|uniref:Uncharacterized protein n=1 Tax=Nocardia cyriacigeorgica TaxID=135487 RepID=A0A4U8W3C4_9NOCA|nr:Uncharacterised protein [Nocardia cyriacigeorgica]
MNSAPQACPVPPMYPAQRMIRCRRRVRHCGRTRHPRRIRRSGSVLAHSRIRRGSARPGGQDRCAGRVLFQLLHITRRHRLGCTGKAERDAGMRGRHRHTHPADQRISADQVQRGRGEDGDQYRDFGARPGVAEDPRERRGFAAQTEFVVEQRLEGPRSQRARDAPHHEAGGEAEVAGQHCPQCEAESEQHPAQHQQAAARDCVGPRARGHFQQERGRGPEREQRRDLPGVQAVIGEQQGIDGIEREEITETGEQHRPYGQRTHADRFGRPAGTESTAVDA